MLLILFAILSLDAFRTLIESIYFEINYSSLWGILDIRFFELLSNTWVLIIPKGLNLLVAMVIVFILLKKWIPRESRRLNQYRSVFSYHDLLLNQLPVSVVITDLDGHIEYVNQKFLDLTGYSKEDLLGTTPALLKSGGNTTTDYKELWDTISIGQVWRGRFRNKKKDGTYYFEDAVITPVFNDEGKITNYLGIKEDITDSVEMYNSYEKAHTVVEQTHDSVEILDIQGRIEYVNAAFVNTTGYSKEEVLGKDPLDLFWDKKGDNKVLMEDLWKTVSAANPGPGVSPTE